MRKIYLIAWRFLCAEGIFYNINAVCYNKSEKMGKG